MLHIGQLRVQEAAQPLQLVGVAQLLGADDLVELGGVDVVFGAGLGLGRRLVVEIGLAGLTVRDFVGRRFGRHLRVALHLGVVFLTLLRLHLAGRLVLGLLGGTILVLTIVLVLGLVVLVLGIIALVVAVLALFVLRVLAVVLHFQVGDHLARLAGEFGLVVDIGQKLAQALPGLLFDVTAEKGQDTRDQGRRDVARQHFAGDLAQHVGKSDLVLGFLAADARAFQVADIGRLQILAHALQGAGADGFQARLFQGVEGFGALVVARSGARVDGLVMVGDAQRHAVGDAANLLGLLGRQVTRWMRQDELVALDLGPVRSEHDFELRAFGQGARRMGQRLLEGLTENGRLLGHRLK